MKKRRGIGLFALFVAVVVPHGPASAQEVNSDSLGMLTSLAAHAPFLPSDLGPLLRGARTSGANTLLALEGPIDVSLSRAQVRFFQELGRLPHGIVAMDLRRQSHALLVDERGGIFVIDLRGPLLRLDRISPQMPDDAYEELRRSWRNIRWFVVNGWDPPRTERQALLMGLGFVAGQPAEVPFFWVRISGSEGTADPAGSCSVYETRARGSATVYAVCREGDRFVRRQLAAEPLAQVRLSADGALTAMLARAELVLADNASAVVRRWPYRGNGTAMAWLDADNLLLFNGGDPNAVVNLRSGSAPAARCGSQRAEPVAVSRVEQGEGAPTAVQLSDGAVLTWDRAARCFSPG